MRASQRVRFSAKGQKVWVKKPPAETYRQQFGKHMMPENDQSSARVGFTPAGIPCDEMPCFCSVKTPNFRASDSTGVGGQSRLAGTEIRECRPNSASSCACR